MEIFLPTNLFIRVDLPELGIPTKFTKPDFKSIFPKLNMRLFYLITQIFKTLNNFVAAASSAFFKLAPVADTTS